MLLLINYCVEVMSRTGCPEGSEGTGFPMEPKAGQGHKLRLKAGVENSAAFVEQRVRVCICIFLGSKTHVKEYLGPMDSWALN